MVYASEEKDKIASALVYLIYNIIPYLKNHRLVPFNFYILIYGVLQSLENKSYFCL